MNNVQDNGMNEVLLRDMTMYLDQGSQDQDRSLVSSCPGKGCRGDTGLHWSGANSRTKRADLEYPALEGRLQIHPKACHTAPREVAKFKFWASRAPAVAILYVSFLGL